MTFFHDVLLALADVAKTDDPDQMTRLFFERLHGIDNRFSFEFMDREPRAGSGSLVMPIATPSATYGYVVAGGASRDWNEETRDFFQAVFDLLAVLLENRRLAKLPETGIGPDLSGEGRTGDAQETLQAVKDSRRYEDQLAHSRDLMRYVIEHSNSAVAVLDRNLRYVYVSQRYIDDYKLKDRHIVGRYHYDVFPEITETLKEVHRKTLQGQVSRGDRDAFVRTDGTVEWIRWECRPWFEEDKTIGGIVLYTENVSERVEAEERLRNSEARFRLLADSAPVGILILEGFKKVIYTSRRFTEIFGYTMDDIPTVDAWWPLAYPDEALRTKVAKAWAQAVEQVRAHGGEIEPVVYPVRCRNGETRHIEFRMTLAGDLNFVIFIDVTARTLMEMELRTLKDRLEKEVSEKTRELQARVDELERFHDATVEREFRIKELRDEIDRMKGGQP